MNRIERHSSHPEILVGRPDLIQTLSVIYFAFSVVALVLAFGLLMSARATIARGTAQIESSETRLNAFRVDMAKTEGKCEAAIMVCSAK